MNDDIRTWLLNPVLPRPAALPHFDRDSYGSIDLDPDAFEEGAEEAPTRSLTRELLPSAQAKRKTG